MNNSKIEDLTKRTIILLENTKKEYVKFTEERNLLYGYLVDKNNVVKWEKYLNQLEEIIKVKE
ncbi:MAG: hypothetical protein HFJ38_05830 [Bacilli bacterium]|nr:hypothetical protein [Bacilli bacterium]